jgi:hypothetical protein
MRNRMKMRMNWKSDETQNWWDIPLIQPSWRTLKLPLSQHHLRFRSRSASEYSKYDRMNNVFWTEERVLIRLSRNLYFLHSSHHLRILSFRWLRRYLWSYINAWWIQRISACWSFYLIIQNLRSRLAETMNGTRLYFRDWQLQLEHFNQPKKC